MFGRLYFSWSFSVIGFAFLFPLNTFANNQTDSDDVGESSHRRNCHGLVLDFKQQPVSNVVVRLFSEKGTENQYDMTINTFEYKYELGSDLYRVNCSFCHGNEGLGDGPAKDYIISEKSYYSTNKVEGLPGSGSGTPYISPPQLNDLEERYGNSDSAYNRISQMLSSEIGFGPMPGFSRVLSKEERKQITEYILDKENGLNK